MTDFDQAGITKFFNDTLDAHQNRERYMQAFPRSGYALIDVIPHNAHILDVGCGKNLFKQYFPNLIGIDPIGAECDHQVALLDYVTDKKFDVVLCLGSIFGSLNDIRQQIAHIKTMIEPGAKIYWRNHPAVPGTGLNNSEYPAFFYQWSEDTHTRLAPELGFTLNEVCKEIKAYGNNPLDQYRIYAEWTLN